MMVPATNREIWYAIGNRVLIAKPEANFDKTTGSPAALLNNTARSLRLLGYFVLSDVRRMDLFVCFYLDELPSSIAQF